MQYKEILEEINHEVRSLIGQGAVASYIPELAVVSAQKFGMAVLTTEGDLYQVGDAAEKFSIQSISKLFTLTIAMQLEGGGIWQRMGREPSGTSFNSLVQLEYEQGIPRNPFINAGALVVIDIIMSHVLDTRKSILKFVRKLAGNQGIKSNQAVAISEKTSTYRNAALANFIKSFGNLFNDPEAVLDAYYYHCALEMSCIDLAKAGLFLAKGGELLWTGERLIAANQTKYINSLMLTCGTYDAVGDFAYRVGLPGKSGVGGGILAVMPGEFSVCVWSPGLNESGNSLVGTRALELFTTLTGISIF